MYIKFNRKHLQPTSIEQNYGLKISNFRNWKTESVSRKSFFNDWTSVYKRVEITFSTNFKVKICIFTNTLFMICNNSPIVFSEYLLKKRAVRPSALDPILLNSVCAALGKGMLQRTALIWATTKNRTRNLRPNRINLIKWQQSFSVKFKMIYSQP